MKVTLAGGGLTETRSPEVPEGDLDLAHRLPERLQRVQLPDPPLLIDIDRAAGTHGRVQRPGQRGAAVNVYAEPVQLGPDAGPTSRARVADCSRARRSVARSR
jgi:hypothetical protein